MKTLGFIFYSILFTATLVTAAELDDQITDRAAIERVYHAHRTGTTETFEQALPASDLRRLVERDRAREKALRGRYGVEISSSEVADEVARIERTTHAPGMLAEIKAALGNDPARFAAAFAKPIVVERELRIRFDNDDEVHAALRRECETMRTNLLIAKSAGAAPAALSSQLQYGHTNNIIKTTWSLMARAADTNTDATTKSFYFEDLPAQLKQVLGIQLQAAGDVGAVIETSENFLLFVAEEKTGVRLAVACLALPKQNCDDWLAGQTFEAKR